MPYGLGPNAYRAAAGALPPDPANNARALVGQGVGMGWGDEAEAAYRTRGFGPAAMLAGRAPGRSYAQELADLRARYDAYTKQYPARSAALETVGSVLPFLLPVGEIAAGAKGVSRGAQVARTGLQETGIGALYGAGKGETPVGRAGGAIAGGLLNGLVGAGGTAGLMYSPEILALAKKYGPQVALALAGLTAPAAARKAAPHKPSGK